MKIIVIERSVSLTASVDKVKDKHDNIAIILNCVNKD